MLTLSLVADMVAAGSLHRLPLPDSELESDWQVTSAPTMSEPCGQSLKSPEWTTMLFFLWPGRVGPSYTQPINIGGNWDPCTGLPRQCQSKPRKCPCPK